jgi:hypothetical protein
VLLLTQYILVAADTRICHETNPLGRLVVTLQNTTIVQVVTQNKIEASDVHFYFDLREGELFQRCWAFSEH